MLYYIVVPIALEKNLYSRDMECILVMHNHVSGDEQMKGLDWNVGWFSFSHRKCTVHNDYRE